METIRKYILLPLLAVILQTLSGEISAVSSPLTPAGLLQKSCAKLRGAKSVRCEFTLSMSGRKVNGSLLSKGDKFSVRLPGASTWYDGKTMWSYNKDAAETTVWYPTKGELAEVNPLLYLSDVSEYNVSEGPKGKNGVRTLVLTPRKRNQGVRKVTVDVNTGSLLPTGIRVATSNGTAIITLRSLKLNAEVADNAFKYDAPSHKGVRVTDLR